MIQNIDYGVYFVDQNQSTFSKKPPPPPKNPLVSLHPEIGDIWYMGRAAENFGDFTSQIDEILKKIDF